MPFDPAYPPENADIESAPLRDQFNALKALIDALQSISSAQVDGVNTLDPGEPATVSLNIVGNTIHFTFGIPRGQDGSEGPPGEVSQQDLDDAINGTSNNSDGVETLGMVLGDADMQMIADKVDELIMGLRRNG